MSQAVSFRVLESADKAASLLVAIQAAVTNAGQFESLIQQLQKLKVELAVYPEIEGAIKLEG